VDKSILNFDKKTTVSETIAYRNRNMHQLIKNYFPLIIFSIASLLPIRGLANDQTSDLSPHLFQKTTIPRLVPDIYDANGVVFRDINGDNLPDIYITCFRGENRLLLNQGAFRPFKDVTQISGLNGILRPEGVYNFESQSTIFDIKIGATIVNIDNDDDSDVFITGRGISTALYLNDNLLNFQNISERLELYPPVETNAGISADIDNDRFPDLFVTDTIQGFRLLRNEGEAWFTDITSTSFLPHSGRSEGAAFSDIDRDGDQDLYVCRPGLPDLFYRNNGSGKFIMMALPLPSLQDTLRTVSISIADIDNDADPDLLVINSEGRNQLYQNETLEGDSVWSFKDISRQTFGQNPAQSYGSVIADLNNDRYQDIYITNRGTNWIFLNNQGKAFIFFEDTVDIHTEISDVHSRGLAYADFDLDGDIDLFISNRNLPSQLFMNTTNNNHFIKFKLIGIRSNKDAIGARVELYDDESEDSKLQILGSREISAGSGYYSQNEIVLHFGLDTIKSVRARFYFPSGTIIEETNLQAGNSYTIYEYGLFSRALILAGQHVYYLMQQSSFWYQVLLVLLFFALTVLFVRLGSRRYKWTAGTASAYLIGFFLLAIITLTALNKLGLLYVFSIINLLTIVFVAIFIVNSERIYKLRIIRERYQKVLIDLSNQIVNIHIDHELYDTVIDNIIKNTEFDNALIAPLNRNIHKFDQPIGKGLDVSAEEINQRIDLPEFIRTLESNHLIQKYEAKTFQDYFDLLSSVILISIERDGNLYGILSLGSSETFSPLTKEDIELFMSLGNQMAIAIENNDYIKRSTEMVKKLTEAEVREKYLKELETTNAVLDSKNRDLQKLYDELKNTQAQLIHSEKMASLGQLVAGISHELNNPIGFIYANVKQLKTYTDKIEKFTESLNRSVKETPDHPNNNHQITALLPDLKNLINDTIHGSQMVKDLVDNLRRFSHLDQAQWKKVNIHDGLESSLMILNPEIKHRIKIEKDYSAKTEIECNPGQINQVFLNLLSNAAQAIKNEGNIRIKTWEDKTHLSISIKDDGSGIPSDVLNKIFDPFYTTKEVGKGTGLGLSISYSIIKNHGGKIEVSSIPGAGSTFTVILPFTSGLSSDRS